MIKAFKQATPVLEKIEKAGYEAYFVGGSVRDYLLNKDIEDVDIATSATPEEIKKIFSKTIDVGIEHGTVIVIFQGQSYEITTFRWEAEYKDFRRPKHVKFIRSLNEDLMRRDFTMNAIAMNKEGKLLDPYLGNKAIKNRVIETVGNADHRFSEDALRMMRAVRFVSQLSFVIEKETFIALKRNSFLLKNISIERKLKEFEKLLCGTNRRNAFQILIESDLHFYLPGLNKEKKIVMKLSQYACEHLTLLEMWALLVVTLDISDKAVILFLKEWKLSNQKIKCVEKIIFYLQKRLSQNWDELDLFHSGLEIGISVEKLFNVINGSKTNSGVELLKNCHQLLPIKSVGELAVSGQDLMNWRNEPGGPWIKATLEKIVVAILTKKVPNDKEAIREWLLTCNLK